MKNLLSVGAKRALDVTMSLLSLILCFPPMVLIAVLIKKDDRGPVLYRGVRIGRFGKPFYVMKFRSLVVDAERRGGSSTADDDPRITRIGRFLRKYKLDELPQLFNVLRGEMSFVGPRPEVKHYVELFTEEDKVILSVRPGITDWASLWNSDEGALLAGQADPERVYLEQIRPEKIRLQLKYVREWSVRTDFKIIILTLKELALRKRAARSTP
jgi:lipopolysaccharide/colanic/teichoic acid biosynthesis glycosyltransferase